VAFGPHPQQKCNLIIQVQEVYKMSYTHCGHQYSYQVAFFFTAIFQTSDAISQSLFFIFQ
jgi:hypothetical protein